MPVVHELRRADQRGRHRAFPGWPTGLDRERFPWALFLVLGDADRPSARDALGGLLKNVGPDAEGIAYDEADRAGNCGVRAEPWPKAPPAPLKPSS